MRWNSGLLLSDLRILRRLPLTDGCVLDYRGLGYMYHAGGTLAHESALWLGVQLTFEATLALGTMGRRIPQTRMLMRLVGTLLQILFGCLRTLATPDFSLLNLECTCSHSIDKPIRFTQCLIFSRRFSTRKRELISHVESHKRGRRVAQRVLRSFQGERGIECK